MGPLFFVLTVKNAEEFFRRCLEKEAVTEKERLEVMREMSDEKRLLLAGELESKAGEALTEFFERTKHKGVVLLKQKSEHPE